MTSREFIVTTLREHAAELHSAGLVHLHLFGSVARDESNSDADIDLLADFDAAVPLSLLKVSRIQNPLSDILGETVSVSATSWLKEKIRDRVLKESIRVF